MTALYSLLQELLGVDARIRGTGSQLESEPGRVEFRRGPQAAGFGDLFPRGAQSPLAWTLPSPAPFEDGSWGGRVDPRGDRLPSPESRKRSPAPQTCYWKSEGWAAPPVPTSSSPAPPPAARAFMGTQAWTVSVKSSLPLPSLNLAGPKRDPSQASWRYREPGFLGDPWPRPIPFPNIFCLNFSAMDQNPGSGIHLENVVLAREVLCRGGETGLLWVT